MAQSLLVEEYLAEPLAKALQSDHAVRHRHAHVTQDRGVREVSLEAGDGELAGKEAIDSIGQPEVALCVLEVNGIDLVRHG